jgi:hypothetical protein
MIELRRMTKFDRFDVPSFPDGSQPLIGNFKAGEKEITVIVDADGIGLVWEFGTEYRETRIPTTAMDAFNLFFQLQPEMREESLKELLRDFRCHPEWLDGYRTELLL